jgi:flagellar motor switch protein FliM
VEQERLITNLGRVELDVSTQLDVRLTTRDLLAMKPGDVVSLGHSASSPVSIHVGQIRRFLGRLTTTPDGAGVRVERTSGEYESGSAV